MEVGERVESDHMPIVVTVKERVGRGGMRGRKEEERWWEEWNGARKVEGNLEREQKR
ncbi:hypothetical protein X777_11288 [Ooceraea biroi]|uniref:Uncharacterized protein n=1 Tax=Ooceraea biroi TaxID=2015173 RepID=A0A026W2J5_OOCBI|nr:hypothetical protein X777_11288 [Ooceraea biroi]